MAALHRTRQRTRQVRHADYVQRAPDQERAYRLGRGNLPDGTQLAACDGAPQAAAAVIVSTAYQKSTCQKSRSQINGLRDIFLFFAIRHFCKSEIVRLTPLIN